MAMATPPPSPGDTTVKVPPAPDVKFRCTDQRGWSNPTGEVLRPLAEGVWVAERAFMPAPSAPDIGGKTTVIKLSSGTLFVHNPLLLTADLAAALAAIGPVSHVVSASMAHHGYVAQWLAAYPDATGLAPPGLAAKCPSIPLSAELGDTPPPDLAADFEQVYVSSVPAFSEVVFFHRPSGTLLITDLLMHIGGKAEGVSFGSRLLAGVFRGPVRLATRTVLAKDKAAFREQVRRIAAWDSKRMVMAHGTVVEGNVQVALREWFPFL